MDSAIVMQEAGCGLGSCEAADEVIWNEILEGKSWGLLNDLIEWAKFEKAEYLTMLPDVGNEPKTFPSEQGWRPRGLLACEEKKGPG